MTPPERSVQRDQTFLFADLAGFTAMTEAHGDDHAADLAGEFAARSTGAIAAAGAEQIKTIGDALMIRSPSAAAGIVLGVHLASVPPATGGFPAVRVGMHTGPAVARGSDWFGATVNIAARIAALAEPGQVLISENTYQDAIRPAPPTTMQNVAFRALGERTLRNVATPVVMYCAFPKTAGSGFVTDPVCRMLLRRDDVRHELDHHGQHVRFCSQTCLDRFLHHPELYES